MEHFLTIQEWTLRVREHEAEVASWADSFVGRRKRGIIHPVYDFLFTYYPFSPQKLKRWVPSFQETLEINSEVLLDYPWLDGHWFKVEENSLCCDHSKINFGLVDFVHQLCANVLERPSRFGCFGLHEWAMVYRISQQERRYQHLELRLHKEELAHFVDSQTLCCSHYDANRFFTQAARPLNVLQPTIENRLEMEQGGCVHVNMDLYKWGTKLWPWVGSDFIRKAFLLAVQARELDMRASPYDLKDIGFPPICIETEEGRKQYQIEQMDLAEKARPLRHELKTLCEHLRKRHEQFSESR